MSMLLSGAYGIPSNRDILETQEGAVTFGPIEYNRAFLTPSFVSGAARDAGNTPTTILRPGLILGQILASQLLKEWDPAATDGSEKIFGILAWATDTQFAGSNENKWLSWVLTGGLLKANSILIPGNSSAGLTGNSANYVRALLSGRFQLDLNYAHSVAPSGFGGWANVRHRTSSLTLTADDNNTLFTNKGASGSITFTLPAVASSQGLRFGFAGMAAQDIVITSPTSTTLLGDGTLGTSLTMAGGTGRGGLIEILGMDGSFYLAASHLGDSQLIAVA